MNSALLSSARSIHSRKDQPAQWGAFVALCENRSALEAVVSLSEALLAGRRPPVNPLVLHGPTGTGKSHLAAELVRHLSESETVATARTAAAGDLARTSPGFADPDLVACDLLVLEDVQLV